MHQLHGDEVNQLKQNQREHQDEVEKLRDDHQEHQNEVHKLKESHKEHKEEVSRLKQTAPVEASSTGLGQEEFDSIMEQLKPIG